MKILLKYKIECVIVALHLLNPFGSIGVILGSVSIFLIVALKHQIDIISIFILLLPGIAFKEIPEYAGVEITNSWFNFYLPSVTKVFFFGPIAVSTVFFAALAVPFRILVFYRSINNQNFVIIWFLSLIIAIYGLFLSLTGGYTSDGGITVGLRIVLAIGAVLFPLAVDKDHLEKQLNIILKISLGLFILGLLMGSWLWVAVSFPAFLIFSDEKKGWKLIGVVSFIMILFLDLTFTLKLTAISSFLLMILFNKNKFSIFILKTKLRKYLLILFPILFMVFIVYFGASFESRGTDLLSDKFISKLIYDRGMLWKYSLDLILNSNFFVVPAARDIIVFNYYTKGEGVWGFGAHNIYLEMARHLGIFVTLILTFIIFYFLINSIKVIKQNQYLTKILLSLFAVYLVFGLTGNALVYDGTGFLFWLIIGQIYQTGRREKTADSKQLTRINLSYQKL